MTRSIRFILNGLIAAPVAAIVLMLSVQSALAANHFVRSGASGNGTGSDWTNACTDFTGPCAISSLVRGDTYYVGTGTYASRNFNKAVSGSSVITVKGATVADHGTATGWSNAFSVSAVDGGSQALWEEPISFDTGFWLWDGNEGAALSSDPAAYGFKIKQPPSCSSGQDYVQIPNTSGMNPTDVTVKHVAIVSCGPSFDVNQNGFSIGCGACTVSNINIQNVYQEQATRLGNLTNASNVLIEYAYVNRVWGSSAHHGDTISGSIATTGVTVRNSIFIGGPTTSTGTTGTIVALQGTGPSHCTVDGWKIYGNVFVDYRARFVLGAGGANNVVCNTTFYNNTIVGGVTHLFTDCDSGDVGCASSTGNDFKNNICYLAACDLQVNSGRPPTHDYNSYLSATGGPASESHSQIVTFSGCPFVNCNVDTRGNWRLTAAALASCASTTAVCAGTSLASPYDIDIVGTTRSVDGTWERGAFAFSAATVPSQPQNLIVQ